MINFLFRRIIFTLLVSILIIFFVHLGMRMVVNSNASVPSYDLVQHSIQAWRDSRNFIELLIKGDLGFVQFDYGLEPISDILKQSYSKSMGLLFVSLVASTIIGIAVGSFLALTRQKRLVLPILTITIFGISAPSFFAAILLQQGEILYLRTFGHRLVSIAGFGWDFEHMLLPLLVLSARPIAYLARASYLDLSQIMDQDYIRTAFAKGLPKDRIVLLHAFRNFAVPVLTAVGVSLRFSLGSLPIVEVFFRWPGVGYQLLNAIDGRQTQLVAALALAIGLTFLLTNLFLDLVYRLVDPRLRGEG
jgi:peptide/nickel transport system permease protein